MPNSLYITQNKPLENRPNYVYIAPKYTNFWFSLSKLNDIIVGITMFFFSNSFAFLLMLLITYTLYPVFTSPALPLLIYLIRSRRGYRFYLLFHLFHSFKTYKRIKNSIEDSYLLVRAPSCWLQLMQQEFHYIKES